MTTENSPAQKSFDVSKYKINTLDRELVDVTVGDDIQTDETLVVVGQTESRVGARIAFLDTSPSAIFFCGLLVRRSSFVEY